MGCVCSMNSIQETSGLSGLVSTENYFRQDPNMLSLPSKFLEKDSKAIRI